MIASSKQLYRKCNIFSSNLLILFHIPNFKPLHHCMQKDAKDAKSYRPPKNGFG